MAGSGVARGILLVEETGRGVASAAPSGRTCSGISLPMLHRMMRGVVAVAAHHIARVAFAPCSGWEPRRGSGRGVAGKCGARGMAGGGEVRREPPARGTESGEKTD